jgi:hypothetical protein
MRLTNEQENDLYRDACAMHEWIDNDTTIQQHYLRTLGLAVEPPASAAVGVPGAAPLAPLPAGVPDNDVNRHCASSYPCRAA